MSQTKGLSPHQQENLIERFKKGELSPREFLDQATDGLFKEKRKTIAERHEKYFGNKVT